MTPDRQMDWRLTCLEAGYARTRHLAHALRCEGHGLQHAADCHRTTASRLAAAPKLMLWLCGTIR